MLVPRDRGGSCEGQGAPMAEVKMLMTYGEVNFKAAILSWPLGCNSGTGLGRGVL